MATYPQQQYDAEGYPIDEQGNRIGPRLQLPASGTGGQNQQASPLASLVPGDFAGGQVNPNLGRRIYPQSMMALARLGRVIY